MDKIRAMRNCLALFFVLVLASCSMEPPTPEACTKKCYDDHAICMDGLAQQKPEVAQSISRFCHKTLPNCLKQCPLAPK